MRYLAKYKPENRLWFVFDLNTQTFTGTGNHSRHTINRRVDKLNGEILARKARMKADYGMRHPVNAPPPRAYKDNDSPVF